MFRTIVVAQCAFAGAHLNSNGNHETLSMAGALNAGNHMEEHQQLSMADMIAQSQGTDMQAFYKTEVKSPPVHLVQLVSKFHALEARFLGQTDPALLPAQGFDMNDHKAVPVKEVAHKDMESITADWGSEYGPHHAAAKPAAKPADEPAPAADPPPPANAKAEPAPEPAAPKSGASPLSLGFTVTALVLAGLSQSV